MAEAPLPESPLEWQSPLELSQAAETESILGDLRALRDQVPVDPNVCVAIVDGPVDLDHPCFRGARLRRVDTLVDDEAGSGPMSEHGTHVTSVVFGQPFSGTLGLAPGCQGLVLPVFRDIGGRLSQLDLARSIERAVGEGANVVNVSGGQLVEHGQPDPLLARAVNLCEQSGVLVVAATGNDGCDCVHVPAALPTVLAVGALGRNGTPVSSSNFGDAYSSNGVLAPGEQIPGAVPGGAIALKTGSSFATPIVSALAALLLSEQRRLTGAVDIAAVRQAILASAHSCPDSGNELLRCLGGILNVPGAHALITKGGKVIEYDAMLGTYVAVPGGATARPLAGVVASSAPSTDSGPPAPPPTDPGSPPSVTAAAVPTPAVPTVAAAAVPTPAVPMAPVPAMPVAAAVSAPATAPVAAPPPAMYTAQPTPAAMSAQTGVGPSNSAAGGGSCSCGTSQAAVTPAIPNVYALGNIGFDFGTEARRDTFRAQMQQPTSGDSVPIVMAPNPYDTSQLAAYLSANPSESTKLIWTLNLDLTPVYALQAEVPYANYVYEKLIAALVGQSLPTVDSGYISRVSIPGKLTTRTVKLFSGQVVPLVVVQNRGLYLWSEPALLDQVVASLDPSLHADRGTIQTKIQQMLDKIYYELRNLGTASPDRAINYMGTNAFALGEFLASGLMSGRYVDGDTTVLYQLDSITAAKSPYCRVDSDCWDVQFSFFNPDNDNYARVVFQSTVDVSDELPVQLTPTHQFMVAP
jgi:cyanobactin maturation PatA/PatG family protease